MRLNVQFIPMLTFLLLMFCAQNSSAQGPTLDLREKVVMRMIGHRVLLSVGDDTARVLPITRDTDHYKIALETNFSFQPEALAATIDSVMTETNIASSYVVEVVECTGGDVVYSYEISDIENKSIVPCQTREVPIGCYNLYVTLRSTNPPSIAQNSSKDKRLPLYVVPFGGILLFVILLGIVLWRRRKKKVDPNAIHIGQYTFNTRTLELALAARKIELTGKEADLLLLLYQSVNETVERDVILNAVWGDEGDYIGRTLDVFISKLRKKLSGDPDVKIVNVRGVGYKLILLD